MLLNDHQTELERRNPRLLPALLVSLPKASLKMLRPFTERPGASMHHYRAYLRPTWLDDPG